MRSLIICPARNRPENIKRLGMNLRLMDTRSDILVAADEDQKELYSPMWGLKFEFGPNLLLGPKLNYYAMQYVDEYDAIFFISDDNMARTHYWDSLMLDELSKLGSGIVYPNDLVMGNLLPTSVLISTDIVRELGYFCPPTLDHLFLDNYWLTLGEKLGRVKYCEDIILEHLHPCAGRTEWDDQYKQNTSGERWGHDRAAWEQYQQVTLNEAVDTLKTNLSL